MIGVLSLMIFGASCAGSDQPVFVGTTSSEIVSTAAGSDLFEPRVSGPLTEAEVRERAPLSADDPEDVKPENVEVIVTTWEHAASLIGNDPSSSPNLDPASAVMVAIVHAPITNTDLPPGAEPTTYESYTIVFETQSAHGFTICMGCPREVRAGETTTTQSPADND